MKVGEYQDWQRERENNQKMFLAAREFHLLPFTLKPVRIFIAAGKWCDDKANERHKDADCAKECSRECDPQDFKLKPCP